MRDDPLRLQDILDAISAIERYASRGREAFDADELIRNWVIRHLQIIGEAARVVTPALKTSHPEVPWIVINGMRNVVVHAYSGLDMEKIWAATERDLPSLKIQIADILAELRGGP